MSSLTSRASNRRIVGELDGYLALAADLADAAGEAIRPHFRQRIAVHDKPDLSPVTIADRNAEAAMRRLIAARFPNHGIIGEEYGAERADAEFVWVLDPIDGTKSFISGVPNWGPLIALLRAGEPVFGVMNQPFTRERFSGDGGKAYYRGPAGARDLRGRPCARPSP